MKYSKEQYRHTLYTLRHSFSQQIRQVRIDQNKTIPQICKEHKLTPVFIHKIENGGIFSLKAAAKILVIYNKSARFIIE